MTTREEEGETTYVFIVWRQFKLPVVGVLTFPGERSLFGRLSWPSLVRGHCLMDFLDLP